MNYLQISPKAKMDLIQPLLKNQQLMGIAALKVSEPLKSLTFIHVIVFYMNAQV